MAIAEGMPEDARERPARLFLALAGALPFLLAVNLPPSPTFFNQLAALGFWGLACAAVALTATRGAPPGHARAAGADGLPRHALLLAGALVVAGIGAAGIFAGLPRSFTLSATAVVGVAMLCSWAATRMARHATDGVGALAWGLAAAGVASSLIALIQVLAPSWPDGSLIARSSLAGRAVGNLRQPNHLASLLLLSSIAIVPLAAMNARSPRGWVYALFGLMVAGITLSGSRTGMLGVALLAVWGALDRRLAGRWRLMLVMAPAMLLASWAGFSWWAARTSHVLGATARLTEADISGSRFAIWHDTFELIRMHPWTGVGWGHFNLAWSLTPFPGRPTAFFDHTHNFVLQLVVELGLPLGLLVTALLLLALWQAGQRAWRAQGESAILPRALFMMVLMMALHSQLEYPLWYAHFLLPTAFAWGACLAWPVAVPPPGEAAASGRVAPGRRSRTMAAAGLVAAAGSVYAGFDYLGVSSIFDAEHHDSLVSRIDAGRRSPFFAHHAEYARATVAEEPGAAMDAFDVAKYHLLDTRLMMAWARACAERGERDRARHIAARLREFRNPASKAFLAACDAQARPQPFQCEAAAKGLDWTRFIGDRP